MNNKVKELVLTAMFSALIAIGAFLKIPLLTIPMTLQSFFVILTALFLRKRMAALSVFIYIFIGLIGVPVFTGGGGIVYIFSPTFGYLIGFIFSAYFIATFKEKLNVYLVIFIGILIMYIFGVLYFVGIQYFMSGKVYSASFLIINLFLIFLPKDIIFGVIAYKIYLKTKKLINI